MGEQLPIPGATAPGNAAKSPRTKPPKGELPGYRETIAAFNDAYTEAYGARPTWGMKQGAMLKRLLRQHGAEEVQRRIGVLFGRGLDWPQPPYTFGVLVSQFDRLVGAGPVRRGVKPSDVLGKP